MHVLALSGSLRAASINSAFCRATAQLAPEGLDVELCAAIGTLPLFNPDIEPAPPSSVLSLRERITAADALLVASPEYAHGVSGPMKNALDWLVSCEGFVGKPVALINTSPRAHHAYDALLETLRTMSARIIDEASVSIPLLGYCTTTQAMVADAAVAAQVRRMLAAVRDHLRTGAERSARFPM